MNFGTLGTGFGGMGRGGAGVAYEAEALTLFAAMTSQPDETRKGVINTLINSLKSGSVWTDLDLLYIRAAHDSQAGLLNWKTPGTYTTINVNSVAFEVDRGYTGDGATSYLRTQFTPSTHAVNFTLNSGGLGVWSRTNASSAAPPIGCRTTSTTNQLFTTLSNAGNAVARVNQDGAGVVIASADSSGHFFSHRTGAAATELFRNNTSLGTGSVSSTALPTVELVECGLNTGGSVTVFNNYQISASYLCASLSLAKRTVLHNALQAYMTAVGA